MALDLLYVRQAKSGHFKFPSTGTSSPAERVPCICSRESEPWQNLAGTSFPNKTLMKAT